MMLTFLPWAIVIALTFALLLKNTIRPQWLKLKHFFTSWIGGKIRAVAAICAKRLLSHSQRIKTWLVKGDPIRYSALTASNNADKDLIYDCAIQEALQNPTIKNIALTGPYGSGKSSILVTFQERHPENEYLNVSLASFKEYIGKGEGAGNDTAIEYSILQQIFYHVRHQAIPFSRFKRIKNLKKGNLATWSIFLVSWAILVGFLLFESKMPLPGSWREYINEHIEPLQIFAILFVTAGAVYFLFLLLRIYNNSKFNRLNLTSGEIEIKPDSTSSALNVHLDELIYFFEVTKFNVVIIEDLDRFENAEIFTKLREISAIINNSLQIRRKVTFLFALRDDVFLDEKRTKFFDLIIPVIPVVDTNNSGEKIREYLTAMGLVNNEVPDSFISDISMYIDDMRLLLNIMNEYRLYSVKLDDFDINHTDLLAIIIYKNKFPKDFADLHARKGAAYELLNAKGDFVNTLSAHLLQKKTDSEKMLETIRTTHLRSIDELRQIYVMKMLDDMQEIGSAYLYIANNNYTLGQLREDTVWEGVFSTASNYSYNTRNSGRQHTGYGFKELEKRVDPDQTYSERLEKIKIRANYNSEELKKELESTVHKLSLISGMSLQELINEQPIKGVKPELVKHGMLVYLVTSGYLNEYYHYYLSHFYEGSLTKSDMDFFFALKERRPLPVDFELTHVSELIKRLGQNAFDRPEVLNNSMLNYLLLCGDECLNERSIILRRIANDSEESKTFIEQYVRLGKAVPEFFKAIAPVWPRMWAWIDLESNSSDSTKRIYLSHIFKNVPINNIEKLNEQNLLISYMEKMGDFINWSAQIKNVAKIKNLIKKLNPAFVILPDGDLSSELFTFIYEGSYYQLSFQNVNLILASKGEVAPDTLKNVGTANLTTLRSSKAAYLIDYVDKNLDNYLEITVLALPENRLESDDTVKYILESDVNIGLKEKLLDKQTYRLSDVSNLDSENLDLVLRRSKVEAKWENIIGAYNDSGGLSDALVEYLSKEENYDVLSKNKIDTVKKHDQSVIKEIMKTIMMSTDIPLHAINALLKSATYYVSDVDIDPLTEDHVSVILGNDMLSYKSEFYEIIKNKFPSQLIKYLGYQKKGFLDALSTLTLGTLEIRDVLLSSKFSEDEREKIYDKFSEENVQDPILANQIAKLLTARKETWPLIESILLSILESANDVELKKKLVIRYFENIDENEYGRALLTLDDPFRELTNYKEKKFTNSNSNLVLLQKLQERKAFVSTFKLNGNFIKVNAKQKPR